MFLYRIRHRRTGKSYIGTTISTVAMRWSEHRCNARNHRQSLLYEAIRSDGVDAFEVETLATAPDYETLLLMEREAIVTYGTLAPDGYNKVRGGRGNLGWSPSIETRQRMAEAKRNYRPWNVGKKTGPLTVEQRAKLSAASTRRGKPALNRGVTHTDCTKQKMRAAHVAHLGGGNHNARRVEFDGVEYQSIAEAMIALGLSRMQAQYRLSLGRAKYLYQGET